jgi:hypothetical protein
MGLLSAIAAILAAMAAPSQASTRSYGGVVETVGPLNEHATEQPDGSPGTLRTIQVRSTFMEYISQNHAETTGGARNHRIGLVWEQSIRTADSACMLNGQLMAPLAFARAVRPGMWGHIYEDQWFALWTLPRSKWGEVVSAGRDGQFRLRIHRTHNDYHLPKTPPIDKNVAYDKQTSFQLEGQPSTAAKALAKGNWVQVHPPRKQTVTVRTDRAAFNADTLRHFWLGKRGAVNDMTAPARLRGYLMANPDDAHAPRTQLEVTRLRRGKLENMTFRGNFALLLDGRMAPPSIALRPGRAATLITYRADRSPHYVFLWSDNDVIRGRIRTFDADSVTIDLTDRLTGTKTGRMEKVSLADDAVFQLDGRSSKASDCLQVGRKIALYPARGRTISAFAPHRKNKPDFTAGDEVEGMAMGQLSRSVKERLRGNGRAPEHRMIRFDLDFGMPLQGPTRTSHRQLYLTVVTRNGKLHDLTLSNFADHGQAPAWTADVVKSEFTYDKRRLQGELTLDITAGPKDRPSPVTSGRYHFAFDAPVRANQIIDRVSVELDGKSLGRRDLTGQATPLPVQIGARAGTAVYSLILSDPEKRVRPLVLHLEGLGGKFVDAVATSGGSTMYSVDTSKLQVAGDRVFGPVRLSMPASHAGLPGSETLKVRIDLDVLQARGQAAGSFRGMWGEGAKPVEEK